MNILIIEPYLAGSHAAWAEGYRKNSRHNVEILALEGRYWKWRMHGGAVTLARRFMSKGRAPELIIATDMLDLTTFLSLTRPLTDRTPTALYFHENQITYPWQPTDRDVLNNRDSHYGFINFASALAADRVFFNSRYHMRSFLAGLELLLKGFPDHNEVRSVELIRAKSRVLHVGMDLERLDLDDGGVPGERARAPGGPLQPPLILWNHRWEYDKNPANFFRALYILQERGLDFEVAILGERFQKRPREFDEARQRLGSRVVQFGFVEDARSYARWLNRADIAPVTSNHDFFGCSVVEAIHCGCFPILPERLAYPEHLPVELHDRHFYDGFDGLVERLAYAVVNTAALRRQGLKRHVARYGWPKMAPVYDSEMEAVSFGTGPACRERSSQPVKIDNAL